MKEELCVLPVRCKRCNALFDLWYDLQENEQTVDSKSTGRRELDTSRFRKRREQMKANLERDQEPQNATKVLDKAMRQSLCWECRREIVRELRAATALRFEQNS